MEINGLPSLQPVVPGQGEKQPKDAGALDFGSALAQALDKLNQAQVNADAVTGKFFAGEITDLHQVTIAMNEAKLCMQLAVEVRNKVVEAYQEISRMQI